MAIKETLYFVLLIMLPVAMMAKQPRAWDDIDVHAKTPGDDEPFDQTIGKCNGTEMKKQIESIKSLLEDLSTKSESCQQCQAYPAVPASSCKELYEEYHLTTSQVYTLKFGSQNIPVYCHMGNFGCGDGGWTLAMKINATKQTFHYDSHFWGDRNPYNIVGGQTDFDTQETKLPTYWNTPFSKICLGMRIGHQERFVVINKIANSLYSQIADGQYRATSLGRNTWKHLIGSQASLQRNCNKEGFNAMSDKSASSKARIGILGNEYYNYNCVSCDSRIGFGTGGHPDDTNTCGNEAKYSQEGERHIKAMGYILVQ